MYRKKLPPARPSLRILVAEDLPDNLEVQVMLLEAMGHLVLQAPDGVEAVAAARASPLDAVLLDLDMPRMDGFEAAAQIRALPGLRDVYLAAVTGYSDNHTRQRCAQGGFDEFIVKTDLVEAFGELFGR